MFADPRKRVTSRHKRGFPTRRLEVFKRSLERAFVPVKSTADQAVFRDYLARFRSNPSYDRMSFVCHSPTQDFTNDLEADDTVSIWSGERLATMTVKAGLFDWVVSRVYE